MPTDVIIETVADPRFQEKEDAEESPKPTTWKDRSGLDARDEP